MASELLMNEANSDVILKVRHEGYSWRIPAHSPLLATKSPAFQEMLEERAEDDHPTPLAVSGMSPESAVAVLKHIYNDENPTDVTADLLIASQKYNLTSLRNDLEETIMGDMTITQACRLFEDLTQRQPANVDCPVKSACQDMIESHALTVFASDLVFMFSKRTLTDLLLSHYLNVPDEAFVFWGVWRWGRRECSKLDRSLADHDVAAYIDDLIVKIRYCSIKDKTRIPSLAFSRFDRCKGRRHLYCCPEDILKQSGTLRLTPAWDDLLTTKTVDDTNILCSQLSFERDVMLVGMFLEVHPKEQNPKLKMDTNVRLIRERDGVELRRQRLCWSRTRLRRATPKSELEYRLESELTFIEPVFLTKGNIYSIYVYGNLSVISLLWASISKRRLKGNNTCVNLHGDGVTAIREVYVMHDMSVTWGQRGPEV